MSHGPMSLMQTQAGRGSGRPGLPPSPRLGPSGLIVSLDKLREPTWAYNLSQPPGSEERAQATGTKIACSRICLLRPVPSLSPRSSQPSAVRMSELASRQLPRSLGGLRSVQFSTRRFNFTVLLCSERAAPQLVLPRNCRTFFGEGAEDSCWLLEHLIWEALVLRGARYHAS